MPYILYKTDGTKLATVDDASLDLTTDLTFVGRNYSGYGQVVNENFLKLLENFSNSTAPTKPIKGQLWYDSTNKRLNFSPDGKIFKGVANMFVQETSPSYRNLVRGDLWWDSDNLQLKAFDGSRFQVVGPLSPAATSAYWVPGNEVSETDSETVITILKASINDVNTVVISGSEFTPSQGSGISLRFPAIKKGITLPEVNSSGVSTSDYILWGTASHSLYANTATTALSATTLSGGGVDKLLSNGVGPDYVSSSIDAIPSTIAERTNTGELWATVFNGVATSARYADLAERYEADAVYEVGTVLVIGGEKEVTVTRLLGDLAVAGVVSENPAVMMNSEAGNDQTHPYIALKGRVPCKVTGVIKKGDPLITAKNQPGYATVYLDKIDNPAAIFAIAMEDFSGTGVIEVKI